MLEYLIVCAAAFLLCVVLTPLARRLSLLSGAIDLPDGLRKLHPRPTARWGGVPLYFAFLLPLAGALAVSRLLGRSTPYDAIQLAALGGGGMIVLLVGMADDRHSVKPWVKLFWQLVASAVVISSGMWAHRVATPFGQVFELGYWGIPLTALWLVGMCNAINLIDGMDGLAGGVSFLAVATMFLLCLTTGNLAYAGPLAALGGALLGFLIFNFHPAKIFLGDSGAMFLGFILGAISLRTGKSQAVVAIAIPLLVLGLPITDTLVAIIRRWRRRLPIFRGDRHHIHHQLLRIGLSHRQVVIILYVACLLLGGAALSVTALRNEISAGLVAMVALLVGVSVHWLGRVSMSRMAAKLERAKAAETSDPAAEPDDPETQRIWSRLTDVFPALGIDQAVLSLTATDQREDASRIFCWRQHDEADADPNQGRQWVQCFRITHRSGEAGMLVLQRKRHAAGTPNVRKILDAINQQLDEAVQLGSVAGSAEPSLPAADRTSLRQYAATTKRDEG